MDQVNPQYQHVYAIVRIDMFQSSGVLSQDLITIKKVVWDRETAEQEVERLNQLNASKDSIYFWQITRLEPAP